MVSGQTVVHPRLPPRRRTSRADRWWGKAWVRAVEESAYAEADLVAGRSLARSGRVGAIEVGPGTAVAVVEERGGQRRVEVAVPVLDDAGAAALVETVAAQAGRVTALLAGDLPHELVEHAEEAAEAAERAWRQLEAGVLKVSVLRWESGGPPVREDPRPELDPQKEILVPPPEGGGGPVP